ncbi:polysaccharide pyruvyl transferase family protein [Flavivirga eckloniae]|uniref:Polysaccharide pyruvyl transferase family protein n=1 Tax=Flavivirga eckloniae TaxID=1803846 RepID=A0A2K9PM91_9FLAO|nr:polysaccharide pyruvyl transferase family protein [Flavivirga eckloniae]AUP78184.1 polysaccharide pyruvyl transferase family protein [Flavivirga eckloniae]
MGIRLFWWQGKRQDGRENYGDLMSKYLVEKISNEKVKTVLNPSKRRYKYLLKHYLSIGSIVSYANKKSIVWGSGIIKNNDTIRNAKFLAVRGPLTRAGIIEKGFSCPEIYGDPALLIPCYYNKQVSKKYAIGIIPHYVDYEEVNKRFKDNDAVKVIDLLTYDVEKTTDEILECEQIISSSLHGVIVSHAYHIPALWVKFSDKLFGDDIKFYDYFESVGIAFKETISIPVKDLTVDTIEALFLQNKSVMTINPSLLKQRQEGLLKSCPFN